MRSSAYSDPLCSAIWRGHRKTIRWRLVRKKRLNQAKQVQWQNWFGVKFLSTLQLCTKHNVLLSWKFGTIAFTFQNTNKNPQAQASYCRHKLRCVPKRSTLTNSLLSARALNLICFEFGSTQNKQALLWVSSSQKSLVGRTAFWLRMKHSLTDRIDAPLPNWHGPCLQSLCLSMYPIGRWYSGPTTAASLAVQAYIQSSHLRNAARMYDLKSSAADSACTFNFNVIHQ